MREQVDLADYVFLVFTENYLNRYLGKEREEGKGVTFEGGIVSQSLYESFFINEKFIPVVLCQGSRKYVPLELRQYTIFNAKEDYESLFRYITDQPSIVPKKIGVLRKSLNDKPDVEFLKLVINTIESGAEISERDAVDFIDKIDFFIKKEDDTAALEFIKLIVLHEFLGNNSYYFNMAVRMEQLKNKPILLDESLKRSIKKVNLTSPLARSIVREKLYHDS